jgi:hypothetical protein
MDSKKLSEMLLVLCSQKNSRTCMNSRTGIFNPKGPEGTSLIFFFCLQRKNSYGMYSVYNLNHEKQNYIEKL